MQWLGSKIGVSVLSSGAGATTIDTIYPYQGASTLWLEVSNYNHKALAGFQVEYRPHTDATFYAVASTATDYTTSIQWPIIGCSAGLTTLAKDTAGLIAMDIKGIDAIRFKAFSGASSDTIVSLKWMVR